MGYDIYELMSFRVPVSVNSKAGSKGKAAKYRDSKKFYSSEWKRLRGDKNLYQGFCVVRIENGFSAGDIDSPIKLLLDSMVGSIIRDDSQIIELSIRKIKSTKEAITVILECIGSVGNFMKARLNCEEF